MKPKIKWHPTVQQYACQGNGRTGWGDTIPEAFKDYSGDSWSGIMSNIARFDYSMMAGMLGAYFAF